MTLEVNILTLEHCNYKPTSDCGSQFYSLLHSDSSLWQAFYSCSIVLVIKLKPDLPTNAFFLDKNVLCWSFLHTKSIKWMTVFQKIMKPTKRVNLFLIWLSTHLENFETLSWLDTICNTESLNPFILCHAL